MQRPIRKEPPNASTCAQHGGTRIDDILALDGVGSICVTRRVAGCSPVDQRAGGQNSAAGEFDGHQQGREAPAASTKAVADSQLSSPGAAPAFEPAVPGDEPTSNTDRLKAKLVAHQAGPGGAAGAPPATDRQPQPGAPPARQSTPRHQKLRLARPVANTAPRQTPHQPQSPANPPRQAGDKPQLPHMPEDLRTRLNAFAAGEEEAAPAPIKPQPARSSRPPAPPNPLPPLNSDAGELHDAIMASKRPLVAAAVFSFVINMLMLTGPLFMLQVYDRVMTSGSIATLLVLFAMTAVLYGVLGLLELARSRIVVRIGVEVDGRIGSRIFEAAMHRALTAPEGSKHALRELEHLRSFIAGPGPMTFFDAPWTPVYLLVVFALHWTLGLAATLGAILLIGLAALSELRSRRPMQEASRAAAQALELAESGQRNAEAIAAMGMLSAYRARWEAANGTSLAWQVRLADRIGATASASKALRLLMQSAMLAIGAALALQNEISAGTIVAATIIFGRALAPVEQAIGQWRPLGRAREAFARLDDLLKQVAAPEQRTVLPAPEGNLSVDHLRVAAPDTGRLILSGINFNVTPGQMLAIIGPSASGKSTLARCLVGLWPLLGGTIRLDGARLDQWDREALGAHIGYLPQSVELFAGSVKENISRFRDDASDDAVAQAARMAHAHEMIVALPQGYDTQLGANGTYLSAGQRQRIGLARALFGNPALVVLDEPNANLDRPGDEALDGAIQGMRKRGQAVVLVSHRVQAISKADTLLYIDRGLQRAFGPRADVMNLFRAGDGQPAQHRRADDALVFPAGKGRSGAPAGAKSANNPKRNPAGRPGV